MTHKKVIDIETLRSGQPRAYADSEYEAVIGFWQAGDDGQRELFYPKRVRAYGPRNDQDTIDYAKDLFKLHVQDFKEQEDPERNWASGRLESVDLRVMRDSRGEWVSVRIFVIRPYTD